MKNGDSSVMQAKLNAICNALEQHLHSFMQLLL